MNDFWKTWLNIWCVAVAAFGAVIAGGALPATDGVMEIFFSIVRGPVDLEWTPHLRFSLGLMGAITIGWSITFYAVFRAAHELGGATARNLWVLVTLAGAVWYAIDCTLSVMTGFWMNAIPNTLLVGAYLVPVLKTGVLFSPGSARIA